MEYWFAHTVSRCASHLVPLFYPFQGLSRPLLNVYPLDLYATEAQQGTLAFIVFLPATIKILFGFLSDNFPIFGYRRKPYMLLGWGIVSIAMVLFLYSADLTMSYDTATTSSSTKHVSVPPRNAPSIEWLSICFLLFGMGLWLADVMADSIVVRLFCFAETVGPCRVTRVIVTTRLFFVSSFSCFCVCVAITTTGRKGSL